MLLGSGAHLGYCTNIHPGETWPELRDALCAALPEVAARLAPGAPLGLGLRLSARAARSLETESRSFEELLALLDASNAYVFTINGFPYGEFHRGRVKEDVYLPDWHTLERLDYTRRLARLAAALATRHPGTPNHISISTVPGCFKSASHSDSAALMGRALRALAWDLGQLEASTGVRITIGLEPEPACFLETTGEAIQFLEEAVYAPVAAAPRRGESNGRVEELARRHIGLCFDACHAAVGFEEPGDAVARLRQSGVLVTKLQLTSALRAPRLDAESRAALLTFADDVYLHQVSARSPGGVLRFVDLPEALARPDLDGQEVRVHFHVPVFEASYGALGSTQAFLEGILEAQRAMPLSEHLEVETYTFGVLPAPFRDVPLTEAIAREIEWVRQRLDG